MLAEEVIIVVGYPSARAVEGTDSERTLFFLYVITFTNKHTLRHFFLRS